MKKGTNMQEKENTKSYLQSLIPLLGQLRPPVNSLMPHDWEVNGTTEILSDGDGSVKIEYNVPPATRYKDCLPWTLQYLNLSKRKWSLTQYTKS